MQKYIIGKNSSVCKRLAKKIPLENYRFLGHQDISDVTFQQNDVLFIFSYSLNRQVNADFLTSIHKRGGKNIVLMSSVASKVATLTQCYNYPTIKYMSEELVLEKLGGVVIQLGSVVEDSRELPSGTNYCTTLDELADFINQYQPSPSRAIRLFSVIDIPFKSQLDAFLYRSYQVLINRLNRYPCLLRPVDLLLKLSGYRWYGYTALLKKVWM